MSAPESFHAGSGRRRFRPTFWATVFTILALIILFGLGTWQVQRLFWKEEQIALRHERAEGPPIPLPVSFPNPQAVEFTRVSLTGAFRHDEEFYLGARTESGRVGLNIVTPFVLTPSNPGGGRTILVNRGWVPEERRDPATRPEGQLQGEVTIEALLRTDGWKGVEFAKPPNDPDKRFYFWLDLPVMAAGVDGPIVTQVYADAVASEIPGGLPIGGQTRIQLTNDHLEYAITWYSFAVILLVIYFLFHYRREEAGAGREKP